MTARTLRAHVVVNVKRLVLIATCAITLLPLLWLVSASFSRTASLFAAPFVPRDVTIDNYRLLLTETDFPRWMVNTIVVCTGGALLALTLTATMAYAFSRLRFRGRDRGLLALLLLQMIPSSVTLVAMYYALSAIGLLDTHLGLILVYAGTNIPFSAWLLKGFFDRIPAEIEEAALVDGASRRQALLRIVVPLALPMLAVVFLFNVVAFYNDYVLVSVVFTGSENYTVALGLRFFQGAHGADWALFSAAALAGAAPLALLFFSLQRFVTGGLTAGAIKG